MGKSDRPDVLSDMSQTTEETSLQALSVSAVVGKFDRPILVSEWLEASAAQSAGLDKITTKGKEEPLFLDDEGKEEPLFLDDGRTSNPRVTIWWTTMSPVTIR